MVAREARQTRHTLAEIEPAIWRRLVVPWTWHLGQLHLGIQAAFNWWNSHLHEFRIGGLRYGDPELLEDGAFEDDARTSARCACATSTASPAPPSPTSTTSATIGIIRFPADYFGW